MRRLRIGPTLEVVLSDGFQYNRRKRTVAKGIFCTSPPYLAELLSGGEKTTHFLSNLVSTCLNIIVLL